MVRPGAPGSPSLSLAPDELRAPPRPQHTEADVIFMQHMIVHHRQALVMSALVPERAERQDLHALADRIERSQAVEIAFMERWLELRNEPFSAVEDEGHDGHHGHHHHHGADGHGEEERPMAGMLTEAELRALASARGPEFDQLFLQFMIMHHEGALTMVEELLASPGAALDSDMFDLASHVYSDQKMEIDRMRNMLERDN